MKATVYRTGSVDVVNDAVDWSANGYRLPTAAEWEYACRAETTTAYYWGASMNGGGYCWYYGNSGSSTHTVGEKLPNAWGLYDMSGNVWEWCHDWYGDYHSGSVTDPRGASSGSERERRGGGWHYGAGYCRSPYRGYIYPYDSGNSIGFRVVVR